MNTLAAFRKYLNKSDARSAKTIKNIFSSFIIKGFSIVINLALIRITINYLSADKYGVWLTISSMLGWINFFDVGLGHGLRNKLAESFARDEMDKAKSYVSTAYISITILCIFLFAIFLVINHFLNWNSLLNVPDRIDENLSSIAIIVFSMFSLQFILQLINSIFLSNQQSYKASLINMLSNLFILIGIFLLMTFTEESLYNIALVFSMVPVLVFVVINIYHFKVPFKNFSPSIRFFDRAALKDVLHLGVKFFIIQVTVLIFFQTSNFLICRYFSPELVTPYNIAFRYFGIVTMAFSIIMVPHWSAYTEAYVKQDFPWIKKTIKRSLRIWLLFVAGSILMLVFSDYAYKLWLGTDLKIDFEISFFMMLYAIVLTFSSIFIMFINGIGDIKLQMIVNIIGMILFIPLSYFLAKVINLGIVGIIISTIICSGYGFIVAPFQVRRILQEKEAGT